MREQSSGEEYLTRGCEELIEQTSEDFCDKDKDSQTSTVESGYESQSKDHSSAGVVPPCPRPRTLLSKSSLDHEDPCAVIQHAASSFDAYGGSTEVSCLLN